MPIIVKKTLISQYFSIWFFWHTFSFFSPVCNIFLPETLQIPTMDLITSTTFICLVFLPLSESKA